MPFVSYRRLTGLLTGIERLFVSSLDFFRKKTPSVGVIPAQVTYVLTAELYEYSIGMGKMIYGV